MNDGAYCHRDVATDRVREGEIGCVFDEIKNLVEPIERRAMEGPAGPQRGRMPKRSGRSRASGSPSPGEGREPERPDQTENSMQAGRWKDTRMPMRYGEKILAGRGAMARAAKAQGRA